LQRWLSSTEAHAIRRRLRVGPSSARACSAGLIAIRRTPGGPALLGRSSQTLPKTCDDALSSCARWGVGEAPRDSADSGLGAPALLGQPSPTLWKTCGDPLGSGVLGGASRFGEESGGVCALLVRSSPTLWKTCGDARLGALGGLIAIRRTLGGHALLGRSSQTLPKTCGDALSSCARRGVGEAHRDSAKSPGGVRSACTVVADFVEHLRRPARLGRARRGSSRFGGLRVGTLCLRQ
jgi:hypothetical protein